MHKIDSFIKASGKGVKKLEMHLVKIKFSKWKLTAQRMKDMKIDDYKKELEK